MKNDYEPPQPQHQQQTLISQVLLYGVLNGQNLTMEDIESNQLKVGVLQHYQHGEIVVSEGENEFYQMWAYPDGIKIYDNRLKIINDSQPEQSFGDQQKIAIYSTEIIQGNVMERPDDYIYSFVHTDYSLNRKYFTALCWHQKKYCPLNRQKLNIIQNNNIYTKRLPKCTLWQLQNDPLMIDFNKQLVYIPKVIIIASAHPLFLFQRQILKFYYRNVLVLTNDLLINQGKFNQFKELIQLVGYPEAERYFDQLYKQKQQKKKDKHKSKKIKYKQIKKDNLKQFYTAIFFLPNQIQLIDCWNSSIKFTPILFNKSICFSKPNINILGVIKRIGIQNLIKMWKCIILQRHILIFSMNNIDIIQFCETMLYLIQPIRWENIYIPFLPFHLVNNIDAIQSYLIGMSKIHMDYVIQHFPMNQIVLFDLDQNIIIENGGKNLIELPNDIYDMIQKRLVSFGFKKEKMFSYLFKEYEEQSFQNEQEKIFRIKQIFFDALLYLLNNYRLFAKLNESGLLQFDRNGYKQMFQDPTWSQFANELVNTMVFVRLCQYHLYEQKILRWNQSNIGGLFVYCQNILAQKFKQRKFWQVPKPEKGVIQKLNVPYYEYFTYVLKNDLQKLKENKKVIQIEHYLIKYLNFLQLHRENLDDSSPYQRPQRKSFFYLAVDFLFPWVREIEEECRNENKRMNNRNSLRLSIKQLPRLDSLFGVMNKQETFLTRINIQKMLSEYKVKKSNYVNYKLLSSTLVNKQRISV